MTKLFQNYTLIANQPIWEPFYGFSHKTKSKFKTFFNWLKNPDYWTPSHSKAKCNFSWCRVNHNLNSHPADFATCRDKKGCASQRPSCRFPARGNMLQHVSGFWVRSRLVWAALANSYHRQQMQMLPTWRQREVYRAFPPPHLPI